MITKSTLYPHQSKLHRLHVHPRSCRCRRRRRSARPRQQLPQTPAKHRALTLKRALCRNLRPRSSIRSPSHAMSSSIASQSTAVPIAGTAAQPISSGFVSFRSLWLLMSSMTRSKFRISCWCLVFVEFPVLMLVSEF